MDFSCNSQVNGVVLDAVVMAAGASFRLSNAADQNQQDLFMTFFKTAYTDPAANAMVQS